MKNKATSLKPPQKTKMNYESLCFQGFKEFLQFKFSFIMYSP